MRVILLFCFSLVIASASADYVIVDVATEDDRKSHPLLEPPLLSDNGEVVYGFGSEAIYKNVARYSVYTLYRWKGQPNPSPFQVPTGSSDEIDYIGSFLPAAIDEEGRLAGFTVLFTGPEFPSGKRFLRRPTVRVGGPGISVLSNVTSEDKQWSDGDVRLSYSEGTVSGSVVGGPVLFQIEKGGGAKWTSPAVGGPIDELLDMTANEGNRGHTFYPYAMTLTPDSTEVIFGLYLDDSNNNELQILEGGIKKAVVNAFPGLSYSPQGFMSKSGHLSYGNKLWLRLTPGSFLPINVTDENGDAVLLEDINDRVEALTGGSIWRNFRRHGIVRGMHRAITREDKTRIWGDFRYFSINEEGTILAIATKDENKDGEFELGDYPGYDGPDKRHVVLLVPIAFETLKESSNLANMLPQLPPDVRRDEPARDLDAKKAKKDDDIFGTPRNMFYICADEEGKYKAKFKLNIPELYRQRFVCAAYKATYKYEDEEAKYDDSGSEVSTEQKPIVDSEASFNAEGEAELEIDGTGSHFFGEDIKIKVAYDFDGDGKIGEDEPASEISVNRKPVRIKGFSSEAVDSALETVNGRATGAPRGDWFWSKWNWAIEWVAPAGQQFMRIFHDGGADNIPPGYRGETLNENEAIDYQGGHEDDDLSEWFTHAAGVDGLNAEGKGSVFYYYWNETSFIANVIGRSWPFSRLPRDKKILSLWNSNHPARDAFEQFKEPDTPDQEAIFPDNAEGVDLMPVLEEIFKEETDAGPDGVGKAWRCWSPSWVKKQTITVGDPEGVVGPIPEDAYVLVGRSRFKSGKYWFVVKRETELEYPNVPGGPQGPDTGPPIVRKKVNVYLRVKGRSEDLYDYNHNCHGLSQSAAIVQLAYGNGSNGRSAGVIFRCRVDINHDHLFKSFEVIDENN